MSEPVERYHVPYSQVWAGSGGRQQGKIHLWIDGHALCGKKPWYPRPLDPGDRERYERCNQCVKKAERKGIEWPQ